MDFLSLIIFIMFVIVAFYIANFALLAIFVVFGFIGDLFSKLLGRD